MVEIRRRREPHCRLLAIGSSKNDPKPGKKTGTADAPCFQKVVSLFSLCYLLLEKSSKSLIPLSDCPRSCSIASLFFLKISLFPGKNRHGLRLGLLSRQGELSGGNSGPVGAVAIGLLAKPTAYLRRRGHRRRRSDQILKNKSAAAVRSLGSASRAPLARAHVCAKMINAADLPVRDLRSPYCRS